MMPWEKKTGNGLMWVVLALAFVLFWGESGHCRPSASQSTGDVPITTDALAQKFSFMQRGWIANQGQWDKEAAFAAPGGLTTTWVTRDGELRHVFSRADQGSCERIRFGAPDATSCSVQTWVVSEQWIQGTVHRVEARDPLNGSVSYFLGNDPERHRGGLARHGELFLGEVWPGVEVTLRTTERGVEKLFKLHPGVPVDRVQVGLRGSRHMRLSSTGGLVVDTGLGEVELTPPVAWQEHHGHIKTCEARYVLLSEDTYGFQVKDYDPQFPLMIDPILYATYLGGKGSEELWGLAVLPTGDVVVAGWTTSTDFPVTPAGPQTNAAGGYDVFVAKLNKDLSSLIQSTYLGGSHYDMGYALALSPSGDIYVAGWTQSTDFPGTLGGAQAANAGGHDAFVTRLNGALTSLLQSTYVGGSNDDEAYALVVSPAGDVYVAGLTESTVFPKTSGGAAQPSYGGSTDGFVTKFNATLTSMEQSTFLGGAGYDQIYALGLSPAGQIYATGRTMSSNFPKTAGGAQSNYSGSNDVFVARLDAALTSIFQSTYLGGSSGDYPHALAIAPSGEVYIAGRTYSSDFPKTQGGAQESKNGSADDAFVTKLDSLLTNFVQSTYLGGSDYDEAFALALASTGDVYVAGYTHSKDFPHTTGGAQETAAGFDAFVAKLSADLTANVQSTYLGGNNEDRALTLALTLDDHVYVAGYTAANNFPAISEGAQPVFGGGFSDAFVAYLTKDLSSVPQPQDTYALYVVKSGSGSGTVMSNPEGIACGSDCSERYAAGTTVILTAQPDEGHTFAGWSGDCSGSDLTVSVLMDADKTCTAVFSSLEGKDLAGEWLRLEKVCQQTSQGTSCSLEGDFRVTNVGSKAIWQRSKVNVYLSMDATWDGGDALVQEVPVGFLRPGQARDLSFALVIPADQNVSGKYGLAVVDATDRVAEVNETNNVAVSAPIP